MEEIGGPDRPNKVEKPPPRSFESPEISNVLEGDPKDGTEKPPLPGMYKNGADKKPLKK